MSRKPCPILPSPGNSFEGTIPTSGKPERSAASVHDTDYRQPFGMSDIYINRNDPPVELMQRAKRIISRSHTSLEMDDSTAQELIATTRGIENENEDIIIHQSVPGIVPAMTAIPDQKPLF